MSEKLYNVLHYNTTGWEVVDRNKTKSDASNCIRKYMADGINPQSLRIDVSNDQP
jgi:hypothetical protein